MLQRGRAIAMRHLRPDADYPDPRLDPGVNRTCGTGAVRHLGIGVVGLDQRDIRKCLERLDIFLARLAQLLTGIDARGCDRRNAHSVTNEEDDILCLGRCSNRHSGRAGSGCSRSIAGASCHGQRQGGNEQ